MNLIESPMLAQTDAADGSADRDQFRAIVSSWHAGGQPDTLAALQQFPHLRLDKSVILDLAYEEFYLRQQRGEALDRSEFCSRFAEHRSSVLKTIDAHDYLDDHLDALNAEPTKWPEAGDLLGDYRIRRLLGRGGFARVYLADQVITGKRMVVKFAPANAREPKLMGRLEHPNVVPVHDARALPGGMCILVMPHLGDSTLTDLLDVAFPRVTARPRQAGLVVQAAQRHRKTANQPRAGRGDYVSEVLALAAQLVRGLAYLHANGVVHRDLKPTNVLLSWTGHPIILDFNLAEGREDVMRRGAGTLYYMAPEQIEAGLRSGDRPTCDERADLFSFGVILYELLTGRHPVSMPDTTETALRATRREEFAEWLLGQHRSGCLPLRTHLPDVDPAVERLVMSCLAFDPLNRPTSADAIVRELKRIQGYVHRADRWIRRRRLLVAVAASAAILALAVTAYGLAVRPSFAERALRHAQETMKSGQPSAATDELDEVLRLEPENAKARFLRGMARLRLNQVDLATVDFDKAWTQAQDSKARVMLAYCMAISNSHHGAVFHIDGAMDGFANKAALLNNRAFSNFRLRGDGENAKNLDRVRRDLDQCLELDQHMAPAYLNRAELRYETWNNTHDILALESAIQDIDRAIELGLATSQSLYDAALFRVTHPTLRDDRNQLLVLLRQAHQHGRDLGKLLNNSKFKPYFADPEFALLLKLPRPQVESRLAQDGLADPMAGRLE